MRPSLKILLRLFPMIIAGLGLAAMAAEAPQIPAKGRPIIIFYANYGAGHLAAAKAVKAQIEKLDPNVPVLLQDAGDFFLSQRLRDTSINLFNFGQSSAPQVYDKFFDSYVKHHEFRNRKSVGEYSTGNMMDLEREKEFLKAIDPAVIINTWPFQNEAMVKFRRWGYFKEIPVLWVHTDAVSSKSGKPEYFERMAMEVDHAYVPSQAVRDDFIRIGVPAEKVTFSGMPIVVQPRPPLSMEQRLARRQEAQKKLGIPVGQRTFMIEAGSNGIGNYPLMIGSIVNAMQGEPVTVIAATGRNAEQLEQVNWLLNGIGQDSPEAKLLYKRLKPLLKQGVEKSTLRDWIQNGLPKDKVVLKPLGFTPLGDYRLASDADATKPGGLSTAEMGAEGIPMILRTEMASGQELYNVENFVNQKLALKNMDEALIGPELKQLSEDKPMLAEMAASSEKFRASNHTEIIAQDALAVYKDVIAHPRTPSQPLSAKMNGFMKTCLIAMLKIFDPAGPAGN